MRRPPVIHPDPGNPAHQPLDFDAARLWSTLGRVAARAGHTVVERVLWLYYAAQRPDVPRWAKATMYGALAYFVLPLDAIADFLPGVGFVDDMGALSAALLTVAAYIDDDVKQRARQKLAQWFGTLPPPGD
jgi:uncharacterized membrane protein YkvA (DUF1232 family)